MFDDIFCAEHPENNGWWINELESLGADTKNNADELIKGKQDNGDLVEAIKDMFIEEYKQSYHHQEF
jgi:hypothetical protein